MFVIRNVFRARPGKAKALVQKFQAAAPHMKRLGAGNSRTLTDTVAGFWTVVHEIEVTDLNTFMGVLEGRAPDAEIGKAMEGYMDLVESGYREIFKVE